jgi:hypothetical protein
LTTQPSVRRPLLRRLANNASTVVLAYLIASGGRALPRHGRQFARQRSQIREGAGSALIRASPSTVSVIDLAKFPVQRGRSRKVRHTRFTESFADRHRC